MNHILPHNQEELSVISSNSSGRIIYASPNPAYILKKGTNERGIIECRNEDFIYRTAPDWVKAMLCPVLQFEREILVMEKLHAFTRSDDDITPFLLVKYKKEIDYLVSTYELDIFDLTFIFNWGKDEKGNILLLDYGHAYFDNEIDEPFPL